ncbi:signal peptidase I [Gemmata obscuriglobus]|uniref:Signal peptidase I n=1 Tax=Gemmata obscuriglobus TaxID=114 RepID=A0A2Z3GV52_9BACT|nr:S26 family signal peptidase [Gemmata obscuriglobus]AWM37168.1 S26 family signal peptidase [Gemmata obscuriglobus]QEG30098.1 signal peptidase I [Gemmata obscuriglobus]VTS09419.1 signal peptidase i : Peptidase S24 and S26 domain protein OS=Planctomyces limnophilus (strain ATCC 43296 / DSM 3776 / IFAM 1008 / 290) GN=Plim_1125 PE=3 SV=1: Peptidase_S24 [Gemmata obscuriglobus UQM 2246]
MPTATADPAKTAEDEKKKAHRDPAREVVETIVFVVVLVLLLKLFITEAFVIPTGSMAETLYGYQKIIPCPKCGHTFPLNSHSEVEGDAPDNPLQNRKLVRLTHYVCPNCRHRGQIDDLPEWPRNNSGDRVLVLKPLYHLREPERGDVVVFKYPEAPQTQQTAQNYIKRMMGSGGETLAVHRGDLYVTSSLSYPVPDAPKLDWWQPRFRHRNSPQAVARFEASRNAGFPPHIDGGFRIVRKEEGQLLADRRIVWDNDRQPEDIAQLARPRWHAPERPEAWTTDAPTAPRAFAHKGDSLDWLRYRHSRTEWRVGERGRGVDDDDARHLRGEWPTDKAKVTDRLIDNFLGYNVSRPTESDEQLWVGDLILECEAELAPGAEVSLELSRGMDRFRATFGNGKVTLTRSGGQNAELSARPCAVTAGTHRLRFANVDARLWVWVDGQRIDFGGAADYERTPLKETDYDEFDTNREGWIRANDVEAPAGIGAKGGATVRHITLHRDIYYTWNRDQSSKYADPDASPLPLSLRSPAGSGPSPNYNEGDIYYVQPGHYFCMGDNSAASSDSRSWGTVPDRLMLGKAVFVFFPLYLDWKLGWPPVRPTPGKNRVGFIK